MNEPEKSSELPNDAKLKSAHLVETLIGGLRYVKSASKKAKRLFGRPLIWDETSWRRATFATAFVVLVIFVIAWFWVFQHDAGIQDMDKRARALTPFLVGLAAAVTFCTVVWRGIIQNNQAAEQRLQNRHNEDAQLVNLLERAVEHLKDDEMSKISLGMALLEQVALAEKGGFAPYALELVARQLPRILGDKSGWRESCKDQWMDIFVASHYYNQREPTRETLLDLTSVYESQTPLLELFGEFPRATIVGADIRASGLSAMALRDDPKKWIFRNCNFVGPSGEKPRRSLRITSRHVSNRFFGTAIASVSGLANMGRNDENFITFKQCDFSGCIINQPDDLGLCVMDECYFSSNSPPVFKDPNDGSCLEYCEKQHLDLKPVAT